MMPAYQASPKERANPRSKEDVIADIKSLLQAINNHQQNCSDPNCHVRLARKEGLGA